MRTRPRHLGSVAVAALLLLGACASENDVDAPAQPVPGAVTGLIRAIDPSSGPIESFELTRPGDETRQIFIDPGHDYGFDLEHLREHMDGAEPVKVTLDERDGQLFATAIEDA